jgi:hypothetical protein
MRTFVRCVCADLSPFFSCNSPPFLSYEFVCALCLFRLFPLSFNLTTTCERSVLKMWELRRLTTLRASTACYSDSPSFRVCLLWHLEPASAASTELPVRNVIADTRLSRLTGYQCYQRCCRIQTSRILTAKKEMRCEGKHPSVMSKHRTEFFRSVPINKLGKVCMS